MNDPQQEVIYEHEEPAPKGRGCFFWGCLITAILFLLFVVAVPLTLYFVAKSYINAYTSEEPLAIETVELPEEEMAALNARFETFSESVQAGDTPGDLELTAEELNALIQQNPDFGKSVFVRIQDGQIGGDVSIPTDQFPGGGGRFFNASADFDVSMEDGVLIVTVADATVNGNPLPAQFLTALQKENLAKDAYKDPDTAKILRKFESLEVTGDRIILKARPAAAGEAPETEPAAEAEAEPTEPLEPAAAG